MSQLITNNAWQFRCLCQNLEFWQDLYKANGTDWLLDVIIVKGERLSLLAAQTVGRSLAEYLRILGSTLAKVHLEIADITSGTSGLGSGKVYHGLFKANAVTLVARNDATIVSTAETFVVLFQHNHNVLGVNGCVANTAGAVHVSGHDESLGLFVLVEGEREMRMSGDDKQDVKEIRKVSSSVSQRVGMRVSDESFLKDTTSTQVFF